MATNTGLKFSLQDKGNARISDFAKQIEQRLKKEQNDIIRELDKVLNFIERVSQDNIPVDTGAAKDSFFREIVVEGNGTVVARAG